MPKNFQPTRRPKKGRRSLSNDAIEGSLRVPFKPRISLGWGIASSLAAVVLIWFLIDLRVRPAISAAAQTVARRAATEALNEALQSAIAASPDDETILHVETDDQGVLRLASFDFHTVSQIEAIAANQAESSLQGLSRAELPLPVSQSFGGSLLSVMGPELPVRIHLVGSAHTSIRMDVHSVGINQTVHALYLDLTAEVRAVSPLVTDPVEVESSVPIAYVVLNGQIPSTYVGKDSGKGDDVLVLPPPAK